MSRVLKVLAIAALLVTIAGAGLVLYGINTLVPEVEMTSVTVTPAAQAQDVFDRTMRELRDQTFTGSVFAPADGLDAQACSFLTYTVRLSNKGFFPAEWIALEIRPDQSEDGSDVLQLDNNGANVLGARSRGDLAAIVLRKGDAQKTQRAYRVTCYVLGRQVIFEGTAQ